jgi:hypothetical protein
LIKEVPAMTTPNGYGRLAQQHMERYLPSRYAQIDDPDRYFAGLGEEILDRVEELQPILAGQAPAGEQWLEMLGRMNMARLMAEEAVFGELVFLAPETDPEETQPAGWVATFPFCMDPAAEDQAS